MFGKKKPVNQDQVDQLLALLHQAAQTPRRTEQNGPIGEAEAIWRQLDNKATAKAFDAASRIAYLAIEATHIASVTGESVNSATIRLDDFLRGMGRKAYSVFFWPRPKYVVAELRIAGDHLTGEPRADSSRVHLEQGPW